MKGNASNQPFERRQVCSLHKSREHYWCVYLNAPAVMVPLSFSSHFLQILFQKCTSIERAHLGILVTVLSVSHCFFVYVEFGVGRGLKFRF